jgi:multidrug transporter EmrE-like cation transporter
MKVAVALILMIGCTVVANLLLKVGAAVPAAHRVFFGLFAWQTGAGVVVFGGALLFYIWVLRTLPLNIAQSFAAAQFICVILASAVVLSEHIPPVRWFGIALIFLGILVVSLTTDQV